MEKQERATELLPASGSVVRTAPGQVRLVVAEGPDRGTAVVVGARAVQIGSEEGAHLRLSDRGVSRRHAEAWVSDDGLNVRDLGSTNGTIYHGARVEQIQVQIGSELRFGNTRVSVLPHQVAVEARADAADHCGPLVGADRRMREVYTLIEDLSDSQATVLIEGETGTGKELVARALHERSPRASGPFVVVDCTSQPRDLVESNLFGHVRGAFTGASADRRGAFLQADGGTLFLDELGELPPEVQPKFLRVLEQREVQPVGGDEVRRVDVRVVAATHRSLRQHVREGRFREDLYYRLSVVRVELPPLRERTSDLPRLIEHFLDLNGRPINVAMSRLDALAAHPWPGNVRELRNLVDRACVLARGPDPVDLSRFLEAEALDDGTIEPAPTGTGSFKEAKGEVVARFERAYLEKLLEAHRGNLSQASRAAGLDRKHLRDLLRKHGLLPERDEG